MRGWLVVDAPVEATVFRGGIRLVFIGTLIFMLGFAVLAGLAFNVGAKSGAVASAAATLGYALCALGLTTRSGWGAVFGVLWTFVAAVIWLFMIFAAHGMTGKPSDLILIGIALIIAVLFHFGAALYLAYGQRPNLRYRNRVPDPRYVGPHWVGVTAAQAVGHRLGRFGGKLWIVLVLVILSALVEASGMWLSPGWPQIVGVALHAWLILGLVLRWRAAWVLTIVWAGVSFLRGITLTALAEYSDGLFWVLIGVGLLTVVLSLWVMMYFAEGIRPNLVYSRRYRRLVDDELY